MNLFDLKRTGWIVAMLNAVGTAAVPVYAQGYPTKTLLLLVPLAPGGGNDYLRGYMYDFIEMFAPNLKREKIASGLHGAPARDSARS
jgi:hypothetical protein